MTESSPVYYSIYSSPVGELLLTSSERHAHRALHGPAARASRPRARSRSGGGMTRRLRVAREQLDAYFAGELQTFDLPLRMAGTPFQKQVWQGLLTIPYGTTISYAELARRIGRPGPRARSGRPTDAIPIGIIVPCHRVIGANGTLTGYGGGLDRKEWLISHEAGVAAGPDRPICRSKSCIRSAARIN